MKERIGALIILFLAILTIWLIAGKIEEKEGTSMQQTISVPLEPAAPVSVRMLPDSPSVSSEVIRLHILADSDAAADQEIKLKVRDMLLPYLKAACMGAETKDEALHMLSEQCDIFTEVANQVLDAYGTAYQATVSVHSLYFPIRIYGSQTWLSEDAVIFPPGIYDSVQVILGSGKGHNWWCLAWPSLCFIDASYDYIPTESDLYKKEIGTLDKHTLAELFYGTSDIASPLSSDSTEAAKEIFPENKNEITISYGSKLWELLNNLLKSGK